MHSAMLTKLFRQTAVPIEYRSNFLHLYFDIGWFGVLSGSAINFLNIYAIRIGATGFQIGLIGAMSAVVSLFLAIPAGRWLQTQQISKAIFWTAVFYRLGFLSFVFLPRLFDEQGQIWAIIAITFLMAIPLIPLGVQCPLRGSCTERLPRPRGRNPQRCSLNCLRSDVAHQRDIYSSTLLFRSAIKSFLGLVSSVRR